jgi:hypothetical protein
MVSSNPIKILKTYYAEGCPKNLKIYKYIYIYLKMLKTHFPTPWPTAKIKYNYIITPKTHFPAPPPHHPSPLTKKLKHKYLDTWSPPATIPMVAHWTWIGTIARLGQSQSWFTKVWSVFDFYSNSCCRNKKKCRSSPR